MILNPYFDFEIGVHILMEEPACRWFHFARSDFARFFQKLTNRTQLLKSPKNDTYHFILAALVKTTQDGRFLSHSYMLAGPQLRLTQVESGAFSDIWHKSTDIPLHSPPKYTSEACTLWLFCQFPDDSADGRQQHAELNIHLLFYLFTLSLIDPLKYQLKPISCLCQVDSKHKASSDTGASFSVKTSSWIWKCSCLWQNCHIDRNKTLSVLFCPL